MNTLELYYAVREWYRLMKLSSEHYDPRIIDQIRQQEARMMALCDRIQEEIKREAHRVSPIINN